MPVTPRFSVTQDAEFLYVKISVPHIRVSDAEFLVADEALHFYCKPYLLRLRFSGSLVEDERAKAVFDADDNNGTITLHVPKATCGEDFKDLDMLTTLLHRGAVPPPPDGASTAEMKELWSRHLAAAAVAESSRPSPFDRIQGHVNTEAAAGASAQLQAKRRDAALAGVRAGKPLVEVLASHEFETDAAGSAPQSHSTPRGQAASAVAATATPRAATGAAPASGSAAGAAASADAVAARLAGLTLSEPSSGRTEATAGAAVAVPASEGEGCGFAGRYKGVFADHGEELSLVLQCGSDPDSMKPAERLRAMREAEDAAFESGRYLQDAAMGRDDPLYEAMMGFKPHWETARLRRKAARKAIRKAKAATEIVVGGGEQAVVVPDSAWWDGWAEEEQAELARLAKRSPPLLDAAEVPPASASRVETEPSRHDIALCQVMTALAAAAYDARFTCGEGGAETAWTLVALDPCLCWQVHPADPREALLLSARRMLSQPYLRRWDVAATCLSDVCVMLSLGKRVVLRTLLAGCRALCHHDHFAILANTHFLDMIVWVQALPDGAVASLAAASAEALRGLRRDDTGWPLQALDARAARILAGDEAEPAEGEAGLGAGEWRSEATRAGEGGAAAVPSAPAVSVGPLIEVIDDA